MSKAVDFQQNILTGFLYIYAVDIKAKILSSQKLMRTTGGADTTVFLYARQLLWSRIDEIFDVGVENILQVHQYNVKSCWKYLPGVSKKSFLNIRIFQLGKSAIESCSRRCRIQELTHGSHGLFLTCEK